MDTNIWVPVFIGLSLGLLLVPVIWPLLLALLKRRASKSNRKIQERITYQQMSTVIPLKKFSFKPPAPLVYSEFVEPGVRRQTIFYENGEMTRKVDEPSPKTDYRLPTSVFSYEDGTVLEVTINPDGIADFNVNRPVRLNQHNIIEVIPD